MTEPRIQYAQTTDGVSIAYWTLGEGMPFVQMPTIPWSHIQLEWQIPEYRRWYERLAEKRKLVRYDGRGTGLSDRDVTDYSVDAHVSDLEAVIARLGLNRFTLLGAGESGPAAIAYAARHPERVSHLVLWCCWARGSDIFSRPRSEAFAVLAEKEWGLYLETVASDSLGWPEGALARQAAALFRECVTPQTMQAAYGAMHEFDVTDLLPQVGSPTLVLHRRHLSWLSADIARGLASRIADAQLVVLDGASAAPFPEGMEDVLAAIDEFLGEGEEAAGAEAPEAGAFRTILFTDVEGSTAMTQRLGDAKAREVLREHERIVRGALKSHGGSELKTTGDGFMASFSSATRALESAIAMQRAFAAHNESAEEPILVRVGLNAGEPIAEDDPDGRSDLFGTAVIEAARIAAAAKGGEILVSDVVRQLAKGKDFLFADRGEVALKGFDEPVRLYEVRWQE